MRIAVGALGLWAALVISGCHKSTPAGPSLGGSGDGGDGGGCGLRTCATAHANCGPIGDGCGGTIDCGTCSETEFCGGGGPSTCGGHACSPASCSSLGLDCGAAADGCGGTLHCDASDAGCAAGTFCGGNGPNHCGTGVYPDGGSSSCVPRTCADAHANCGPVGDGCGGELQCGSCSAPEACGAAGRPSTCDIPKLPDGGNVCNHFCLQQVSCDAGTTSVSGTVYAPNGVDPLYGALVYIPNGDVQPFTPGVQCLTCESQVTGTPLVSTTTGPDGSFTLSNIPAGTPYPLVIQLGRWRRQVPLPAATACTNTALTAADTRLPRNQSEGDIPLTAMVTGNVDALECVLRKIGLDDAEFSNPGGTGRIQLYTAAGDGGGAQIDGTTPASNALVDDSNSLDKFDMVLLACEGYQHDKPTSELTDMLNYANAGGRVFATHFSYTWLYSPTTWQGAASWNANAGRGTNIIGNVDTSFPKGLAFSQWLDAVGASTAPQSSQIAIDQWRWDVDSVVAPTQQWITTNTQNVNSVQHLTFNTPYGAPAANQCGRVLFSDFHVTNADSTQGQVFPAECTSGPLTAQEHVLEFMLFDLASCISPDQNLSCTPTTCAVVGANCGPVADGCGGTLACGDCPTGETCGGSGHASVCGPPTCVPRTCAQQGIQCGTAGDGCGAAIQCGSCAAGQSCGGGGTPNVCGAPACTPTTCAAQNAQCGTIANGCGATLDCGVCANGGVCGLNGANQCGSFR